jgi:hypothetical protein
VIPSTLIDRQVDALDAVGTLANRNLLAAYRPIRTRDARVATDALVAVTRDLTDVYGEMAASLSADYYEQVRRTSGRPGRFRARTATAVPDEQVDGMVRWAVTPLWATDPDRIRALLRLSAGLSRLIRDRGHRTVFDNAQREGVRYVRRPRGDACAFCLMLASRDDYTSEASAFTVGTSRVRGSRYAGSSFHDNCRCQPVPIYSMSDVPDINRRLKDEWDEVTSGQSDQLAAWREHVDRTRPRQHVRR